MELVKRESYSSFKINITLSVHLTLVTDQGYYNVRYDDICIIILHRCVGTDNKLSEFNNECAWKSINFAIFPQVGNHDRDDAIDEQNLLCIN